MADRKWSVYATKNVGELREREKLCRRLDICSSNRTKQKNNTPGLSCKPDTPAGRDAEHSAANLAFCIRTHFQTLPDFLHLKPLTFYLRACPRTFYLSPPCQTAEAFKSVCLWHLPDIAGQRTSRCWAFAPEPLSVRPLLLRLLRSSW